MRLHDGLTVSALIKRSKPYLIALVDWTSAVLPSTEQLPHAEWQRRHQLIVVLMAMHVVVVVAYGLLSGVEPRHAASEGALLALFAVGAATAPASRALRASVASLGLLTASALLVHISGGLIEMHFHFFVMIAVVTLYQAWSPFLVAVMFVIIHHGVLGVLNPTAVYNHPDAWEYPWTWAGIHGLFVIAASLTGLANWKLEQSSRVAVARAEADAARAQAAKDQAEARLQDRDAFLSIVSHELLTPVTSLRGYAQLLKRRSASRAGLAPDDVTAGLVAIERQSHKLHRLVSQLLDRTRIETGHLRLDRAPTDLSMVIEDAVTAARARDPGRVIDVRCPERLVRWVDSLRLEQVLINLIDNALKYSPVDASVDVELIEASDHSALLTVSDRGPGIPASLRQRIFSRFYRAEGTQHVAGVGLGLYISHEIVSLHGGQLIAEDRPGGGARFIVMLPSTTDDESVPTLALPSMGTAPS